MVNNEIKQLEFIASIIFILAPVSIVSYILVYNRRKKKHIEEKQLMKLTFDAELVKAQLEIQEQTMQTIGADLHDNIGQLLSLTSLTLNSVEFDNAERTRQKVEAAIDLTKRSIKEMRLLGKLLQGDQLMVLGLSEAIRYEINWMEKSGKYQINYTAENMPVGNNPDKDLILFRILQEILNNIMKHSLATVIGISLRYQHPNQLQLQICDNGRGFNAGDLPVEQLGMGLHNIQKRAGIIGGQVTIKSVPGEGTDIDVAIPYP